MKSISFHFFHDLMIKGPFVFNCKYFTAVSA